MKKSGSKRFIKAKNIKNNPKKASGLKSLIDANHVRKVRYGNPRSPLIINGMAVESYVLEDGTRVIAGRGIQKALKESTECHCGLCVEHKNNLIEEILNS